MGSWLNAVANAPVPVMLMCIGASLFGLYAGFRGLRLYRLIEDVPTAKVRSAPQGYVELTGKAVVMDGDMIVSPLSQIPCCWYSYSIERRSDKSWRGIESGTSDGIFMLRDETGDCVIDPEGAEVDTVHSQTWYGNHSTMAVPAIHVRSKRAGRTEQVLSNMLDSVRKHVDFGGEYRYTEKVILGNDSLYAIGWFRSHDNSDLSESERHLTAEILREWKRKPDTLMARFDHDRDGSISVEEWEDARRVAAKEANQQLKDAALRSHVHMLSKPKGKDYILSNREQSHVVKRYQRHAILGLGGFLICGAAAALMISTRFA